jgi:hypothetical protein
MLPKGTPKRRSITNTTAAETEEAFGVLTVPEALSILIPPGVQYQIPEVSNLTVQAIDNANMKIHLKSDNGVSYRLRCVRNNYLSCMKAFFGTKNLADECTQVEVRPAKFAGDEPTTDYTGTNGDGTI